MTLDALTPASVHSLWSYPKHLNLLCLTVFSSLRSSLLLVHIFLPNFFLPVNFAFNMLWYSTPWTATHFSNDPLWLTLFVEGVNDHLLDHCQVSSVPHYCGFKEQEIPTSYTVWMVIYWNSNVNILIFWDTDFFLSLAVSSNQNSNKKPLKCFNLHVINIKYMKVSLFEISYRKKWTSLPYSNFLRCTCNSRKDITERRQRKKGEIAVVSIPARYATLCVFTSNLSQFRCFPTKANSMCRIRMVRATVVGDGCLNPAKTKQKCDSFPTKTHNV